jgi:hypothetical protein
MMSNKNGSAVETAPEFLDFGGKAMNQMQVNEEDVSRADLLIKATYDCLR